MFRRLRDLGRYPLNHCLTTCALETHLVAQLDSRRRFQSVGKLPKTSPPRGCAAPTPGHAHERPRPQPIPPYKHTPLFPLGKDTTHLPQAHRRRRAGREDHGPRHAGGRARGAARARRGRVHRHQPSAAARRISRSCASILDDPEATDNDKFVAYDFLKNANIAAGGVLPMCQDTGTAIIMGKKGRLVFTDGDDEAALAEGARDAYLKKNLRYSQLAPISMFEEKNTAIEHAGAGRDLRRGRATPTSSCSSPRAAARPTRRSCSRRRRRS